MRRLAYVAVLAACGRDAAPPPAPTPTRVPAAPASPAAPTSLLGTSVHLFGPLEGVTFGMSSADVRAKVPGLTTEPAADPEFDAANQPLPPLPERDEAILYVSTAAPHWSQYTLHFVRDKLQSVDAKLVGVTVDDVSRAWGAPPNASGTLDYIDRAHRMHAVTELRPDGMPLALTIEPL